MRCAVAPLGFQDESLKVIVCATITRLSPGYIWMGAGGSTLFAARAFTHGVRGRRHRSETRMQRRRIHFADRRVRGRHQRRRVIIMMRGLSNRGNQPYRNTTGCDRVQLSRQFSRGVLVIIDGGAVARHQQRRTRTPPWRFMALQQKQYARVYMDVNDQQIPGVMHQQHGCTACVANYKYSNKHTRLHVWN